MAEARDMVAERLGEQAAIDMVLTRPIGVLENASPDSLPAAVCLKKASGAKKGGISADMLDTANTYDDKVALIRMLVQEDSGRVATVLKNMIKQGMDKGLWKFSENKGR